MLSRKPEHNNRTTIPRSSSGEENSPAAPAEVRTHNPLITIPGPYQMSYPEPSSKPCSSCSGNSSSSSNDCGCGSVELFWWLYRQGYFTVYSSGRLRIGKIPSKRTVLSKRYFGESGKSASVFVCFQIIALLIPLEKIDHCGLPSCIWR